MKNFLKIFGIIIGLLIIAILTLPFIFKDKLVQIAKNETNKALNAKVDFGDFGISLISSFPDFQLNMKDLTITGIDEFEGVNLAKIKDLSLVLDVMSVIRGETIELKSIILNEPIVYAQVLKNGKANWDIAKASSDTLAEVPADTSGGFSMNLERVEINKGLVIYDDASMPMYMLLDGINLHVEGDVVGDVTSLLAEGKVDKVNFEFDGMEYLSEAAVSLTAGLKMNLEEFKFTFEDNELLINRLPLTFDGWLAMPEEAIDMDLSLASKDTDFKTILSLVPAAFAKDLEGVETKGDVQFSGYAKGTFLDSIFPAFGLDLKIANAMFKYPDLPSSVEDIQMVTNINSPNPDMSNMVVDVSKFHMNMAGNPLDMKLTLTDAMNDAHMKASAKGKLILSNIQKVVPLEAGTHLKGTFDVDLDVDGKLSSLEQEQYQDFKASGNVNVNDFEYKSDSLDYPVAISSANLAFTNHVAELSNLNMTMGKSDIHGSGRLEGFIPYAMTDNGVLKGNVDISSNLIDANELMGITPGEATEEVPTSEEEPMEVVPIPKNVYVTMNAKVNQLLYDNLDIKNINAKMEVKDQKVSILNSSLNMLSGKLSANGFYETTDIAKPTFDFGLDIVDFDLQETVGKFVSIEKIAPIAKKTIGKYSTKFKLAGALDGGMNPLYETLFGEGGLSTKHIEIKDFIPLQKIGQALNSNTLAHPIMKDLRLSLSIADGKLFVAPFTQNIDDIKMTIAGSNSFDQIIDYVLSFEVPREKLGSSVNNAANQLFAQASSKGLNLELAEFVYVDAIITGPFNDPKVKIDLKETVSKITDDLKDQAKQALEDKKKELEQQARDEIEKKRQEAEDKINAEIDKKKKEAQDKINAEIEKRRKEAEEKGKKEMEDATKDKLKDLFGK